MNRGALALADDLRLPVEAATETFGLLAVRGAGKTNAARLMAEQMFDAEIPFVAVDPVGSWYGLRAGRDGKASGLPVPIFGGKHGDVPLERGGGALVADLVVEARLSCVLDLSRMESEAARKGFLLDFARRLYERNEAPLHLFLEEADDYIPQKPMRDEAQLLRAWENIVRRGRARGLGITLISQRSAVVNKNVLTQVGTLIALRATSPQDRDAIGAWLKYHGQAGEILASLAALRDGEAWVWSPEFLRRTVRVQFRRSRTFDSGATPTMRGTKAPATLADVDLAAVTKAMAATIERAKAADPKALRARIAELEREARRKPAQVPEPRVIERPVIGAAVAARLANLADRIEKVGRTLVEVGQTIARAAVGARPPALPRVPARHSARGRALAPAPTRAREDGEAAPMRKGERRMLQTLATFAPERISKGRLATLSGFAVSGGTFGTYLGVLRRAGYANEHGDDVVATDAGVAMLNGDMPRAPQGPDEIAELWRSRLRKGEAVMLDKVIAAGADGIEREALGEAAGFTVAGGTFGTYLGTIRRLGLVTERNGTVVASDELIGAGVP